MPETTKWKILLVDDDKHSREAMSDWLQSEGFEVIEAPDGQVARQHIHDGVAVIVTDLQMPKTDGLALLRYAREHAPHAAVIVVTGHGTVETTRAALKEGAFDYLTKPVKPKELAQCVREAVADRAMAARMASFHSRLHKEHGFQNIVGTSPAMLAVFEKIRLAADAKSTVLVVGDSGTGKELVVRALHYSSSRASKPFIPINVAAIPESLIESELFGHEKGAFTGANSRRAGVFEAANEGTLFIDEIGEMDLGLQSKLLRAIETHKIMPVGSSREVDVDVRLLVATNRNLFEEVKNKKFREDLYYRLNVITINLPPLRERREDIPLLVGYFLEQIAKENQRPISTISEEAMEVMINFSWPGNVRELRNTLEGIVVLSPRQRIELSDLPTYIRGEAQAELVVRSGMKMADVEKEAIRVTLEQTQGRRSEAAKILGISVRMLQRKIKEYDL
ncbi:MAG TPA: sigma-54 dependent transcriptional regulator [Gemmataceae bacterium]|nr:sigma-54 dependent transcriptional regulator [Gemmataceae bacterium]